MDEAAVCPSVDIEPSISVTKECSIGLEVRDGVVAVVVSFSGQVCNDSSGADAIGLTNVTVVDDAGTPSDPTDDTTFNIGDLASGACAPYSGEYVPTSTSSGDPLEALFSDTVTATGTANLGFGDVTETASASCAVCPAD